MKTGVFLPILILIGMTTISCSKRYDTGLPAFSYFRKFDLENQSVGRFKTKYIAEQIDNHLKDKMFKETKKIAVLPFFNLENFNQTTPFGQFMGEQLIFELTKLGFNVVEVRNSYAIYLAHEFGEFFLQRTTTPARRREVKKLGMDALTRASGYNLAGIVCGTYLYDRDNDLGKEKKMFYVNTRLISLPDLLVVSSASAELAIPNSLVYAKQFSDIEEVQVPIKRLELRKQKPEKTN